MCGAVKKIIASSGSLNVGSKVAGGAMVAAGGILGTVGSVVMPVLGIALMFLPEIMGTFFKNANEEKIRTNLQNKCGSSWFSVGSPCQELAG